MKIILVHFVSVIVAMLAIDSVWLNTMYSRFYQPQIGHLLADQVRYGPAAVFYVIYAAGLTILVLQPAMAAGSGVGRVFLYGAVYGLIAYATYDLTNHATLKDWPTLVTVVDMVWGTLLTGTVSVIANLVARNV